MQRATTKSGARSRRKSMHSREFTDRTVAILTPREDPESASAWPSLNPLPMHGRIARARTCNRNEARGRRESGGLRRGGSAGGRAARAARVLVELDDAHQVAEAGHPARQAFPIEGGSLVAYQHRARFASVAVRSHNRTRQRLLQIAATADQSYRSTTSCRAATSRARRASASRISRTTSCAN